MADKPVITDFRVVQRVADRIASYVTSSICNGCGVSKPPHTSDCTYFKEAKKLIEGEDGNE